MTEMKKIKNDDLWLTQGSLWPPSKTPQHNNIIAKLLQCHLALLVALGVLGFMAFAYVAVEYGRSEALRERAQYIPPRSSTP